MVVVDVIGNMVDGGNARDPAVLPRAQNSRQLVTPRGCHRVTDETLNRAHQPRRHTKFFCDLIEDVGFGYSVLRRASAMGLHISAVFERIITKNCTGRGYGFSNSQIISDARTGDGFFIAVGINKDVTHRTHYLRPLLHRQFVIHQDNPN